MSGYWYYQTGEEKRWLHVEDSADAEGEVRKNGGTKMSVLKISQLVGDDADIYTDKFDLKYCGPLYFDIDCGEADDQIMTAIEASRTLVRNLLSAGIEGKAIQMVLSGKKGMHVLVDQRAVTGSAGMITALPAIYRKIAEKLYVEGMDFQVYGSRRGNTFRLVNLQREGIGTYPVHVTIDELMKLNVEQYREFVKGPRSVPDRPEKVKRCDAIYEEYKWAKDRVMAEEKRNAERIPMTDAALGLLKAAEPACVDMLKRGKRHVAATYNQIGNQLGAYSRVTGLDRNQRRSLGFMVADNTPSNSGKAQKERRRLVMAGLETVVRRPTFNWSCGAVRRLLDKTPCEDCPVREHWEATQAQTASDLVSIQEIHGQYFVKDMNDPDDEKLRRITNFILDPVHVVVEQPSDPTLPERRLLTRCQVLTPRGRYGFMDIDDSAFSSKGNFTKQLTGHGNLAYWGSDNQIQSLREFLFSEDKMSDTAKVVQLTQAGLHVIKIPGTNDFLKVFVEPGYSIDSRNSYGTHTLHKPQGCLTDYRSVKALKFQNEEMQTGKLVDQAEIDGVSDAVVGLFNLAEPIVMSQLVGFVTATHLKQHIAAITHQFPTLLFWGPAGSGKTTTMKIVAALAGLDKQEGMVVAANTAKSGFAIRTLMCTSTTQLRIFDEFNINELDHELMGKILQMIKLSWDASTWVQGGLDKTEGGVGVEQNGMSAPSVFMGEQDIRGVPEATAIQHRSVQVYFTKKMRGETDAAARAMMQQRPWLVKLAYALMRTALWQKPEEVFKWRDKYIEWTPAALPDRPRIAYATVFLGLEFLLSTCKSMGLRQDALDAITTSIVALKTHLQINTAALSMVKTQSQATLLLADIGSYMSVERFRLEVKNAPALVVDGEEVFISAPALHTVYRAYCKGINATPMILHLNTFLQLLAEENYVIEMKHIQSEILGGKPCVRLNKKQMIEAGINTDFFK